MQKSIWLFAFLPCLPWLGSLVNGATVSTSTSDLTRIAQPPRLNVSSGELGGTHPRRVCTPVPGKITTGLHSVRILLHLLVDEAGA